MRLGNHLEANSYELRNAVAHQVNGAPAGAKNGQWWWDTAAGKLKWKTPSGNVDPLDRTNHSGNVPAANVAGLTAAITTVSLDQMTSPAADLSMNSKRLRNLPAPVNADEPLRLIDGLNMQAGSDFKNSVRVMTDANIAALSGTPIVDGIQTAVGDRIAAMGQTDPSKRLVYVIPVGAGAWVIADDFKQGSLTSGAVYAVEEGTFQGRSYRLNNTGAVTVGTTNLNWQLYAAGVTYISMSSELDITGNQVTYKGIKGYVATIGDGVTTSFSLSHGLNCGLKVFGITIVDLANGNQQIFPDVFVNANNTVNVVFGTAPASNSIYVAIAGQA